MPDGKPKATATNIFRKYAHANKSTRKHALMIRGPIHQHSYSHKTMQMPKSLKNLPQINTSYALYKNETGEKTQPSA